MVHVVVLGFKVTHKSIEGRLLWEVLHSVVEVESIQEEYLHGLRVLEILFVDWEHPRVQCEQTFNPGITLTNFQSRSPSEGVPCDHKLIHVKSWLLFEFERFVAECRM